ncbi:hypothetical protein HanHA300_Chr16g0623391 [Helianthus annuus]|nr:hypothetical protein HanHA300_Chr16g0623391 [Helianthus annuus]KAJ0444315.1 hypothetical protein HanIR_Chr16g0830501 [Helianthus annuus]KAJ0461608.1 hypothetical protein HanHA89_Chr16g0674231 [Helianthus annuus]KAJ0645904.1 hypothetical protein HanOQP8_Chr16g0629161 [Helianthus annuus]
MSSRVDHRFLKTFSLKYGIHPKYNPTAPQSHHLITDCPDGYIVLSTKHLECSNIRIPFSNFFLDFLKHYKVNISQLAPLGAMKVTHFEIMCRALGGEPSLPLFRQFFVLARVGDCYTVSQRRSRGCISSVPASVETSTQRWKRSVFWVSAEAVPFKMDWRLPRKRLNVVPRNSESYDEKLYKLLVNHPTPLQPFPEHVLVMSGISRNWPNLKAEPVIKDGDDGMHCWVGLGWVVVNLFMCLVSCITFILFCNSDFFRNWLFRDFKSVCR